VIQRLEKNVFSSLGPRPIRNITAPELLAAVRLIEGRGAVESARRILQMCGQIFRYAIATGQADRDIAADLRGSLPPAREKHHASITDPKAVAQLLRAIDGYEGSTVARCALRLAPLVFVRPGELRHAEWAEIDLDKAEWRIPAAKMKMKEQHIVPLSRQAVAILLELHPLTGAGKYVFPSVRTSARPMSENTVLAALRRMGYTKDEMTGHGFRSMASTLLNEMGWNRDAIERQLAHAERNAVRAAYNFAEFLGWAILRFLRGCISRCPDTHWRALTSMASCRPCRPRLTHSPGCTARTPKPSLTLPGKSSFDSIRTSAGRTGSAFAG